MRGHAPARVHPAIFRTARAQLTSAAQEFALSLAVCVALAPHLPERWSAVIGTAVLVRGRDLYVSTCRYRSWAPR